MTQIGDLANAITDALGASVPPNFDAVQISDLYEGYLFTVALKAAELEGATIQFEQIGKPLATEFIFRTSPGHIYSATKPYTYAVLNFPDAPLLEVHLGIRASGKSRVLHECDVAIVRQNEADRCRSDFTAPRSARLEAAIEAKFYSAHLPLVVARAFLGFDSDMSSRHTCFVVNITSESVGQLLAHRSTREWQDGIIPNASGNDRLVAFFRDVFHRHRARR